MKANTSIANQNSSRCKHHFANSSRCRLLAATPSSKFCPQHAKLPQNQPELGDLSAALAEGLTEFKSATPINDFLSRLLLLLAQDRIAPRRAAVMAYITNQLLHTVACLRQEELDALASEETQQVIILDVPRPNRDQMPNPYQDPADLAASKLSSGSPS
ncbi:MAG TPA: hypothetical protein VGI16_00095 [Candidatus Acidoferrum sp.]